MSAPHRALIVSAAIAALSLPAGAGPQAPPRPVFRADTVGIAVDVTVFDGSRTVPGLTAADFELHDNGVRQAISAVSLEQIPFDLSLVVDTSGSLVGAPLEQFKADVRAIGRMLRPEDRLRLVTFATRGADAFGWRPGGADLPLDRIAAGGATAFYQTVAAVLLRETEPGRRHLIVAMSDGYDTVSLLDAPDVASLARLASGVMHVILRRPVSTPRQSWGWVPYAGAGNHDALRQAAEATGGRFRQVGVNVSLTDAFETALDEFRTGYLLWYTPAHVVPSGWHEIAVRAGRDTVRARKGYDAGLPKR